MSDHQADHPGYRIGPATAADVTAVLVLWRQAEAEPTTTDDPAAVAALVAFDPGALLLAWSGGALVGSVMAAWDGWRGSVYRLAVHPGHRRHGLARRLVQVAEIRLAELGARRAQAVVVAHHPDATGFWRASGWEEQEARRRFVRTLGRHGP
jgi:ribosomal protein S18 acetylase RimI-like enzyme